MFPLNDPQLQLDLHRQRVAELIREADDDRLARSAATGRHRWFGRFHNSGGRRPASRVTAAA